METIVALGVATIALSFFLLAMAPATVGIERSNSKKTAQRMVAALENELNVLRKNEESDHDSSFEKAFNWIRLDDESGDGLILAFDYRASSEGADADGVFKEFSGNFIDPDVAEEQQMILQTRVATLADLSGGVTYATDITDLLEEVEGSAFVIKLRHMNVDANGALKPNDNGTSITVTSSDGSVNTVTDVEDFTNGLLLYQAEVHVLRANTSKYIEQIIGMSGADLDNALGSPIYTTQLTALR